MKEVVETLPSDVHPQYFPHELQRAFPQLGPVFYIDNWPYIAPMLIIASPSAAFQVTQEHSLPKFPAMREFMRPIAGDFDLVSMDGPMWKTWRGIFNPGFSSAHLTSLVPEIIREATVFCDILRERAERQEIFPLKKLTDNLTMDIIGKVVLYVNVPQESWMQRRLPQFSSADPNADSLVNTSNTNFDSQRGDNPMVSALRRQIPWLSYGTELNIWQRWHPVRPIMHWYNTRIMNSYVTRELEERFASQRDGVDSVKHSKSIIDLALKEYLKEATSKDFLDPLFKTIVIGQIKLFLFSGHDTTSSSICHIFHCLSKCPSALQRLRAEHDSVLGPSAEAASAIAENPHLLSQLPFTLAVIKETLRLFPSVSSTRAGETGFAVVEDGTFYPTEGCLVWSIHQTIHRDLAYWPSPDDFIPDRWLVAPSDPLYPVKGAWRPFEFGPRNCIGQELAMLEMKAAIVMTVREFDVKTVYEEWDTLYPRKGPKTVAGERAYQAISGGPSDGLPCRVEIMAGT